MIDTKKRNISFDVLKAICAFLVICIHTPFPGEIGRYINALTRIAVPLFFMISGFLFCNAKYNQKDEKQYLLKQLKSIFRIIIIANVIYFLFYMVLSIVQGNHLLQYISSVINIKSIVELLVFNESPFAIHLWYLNAYLYVIIIQLFLCRHPKYNKWILAATPIFLLMDLIFGKYSLVLLNREFPYILVRNWLCVGLPFFNIGTILRKLTLNNYKKITPKVYFVLSIVFSMTTLFERFVLEYFGKNATRDQYISTIFLAISVFLFCYYSVKNDTSSTLLKGLSKIGQDLSTDIYVYHPIVIAVFAMAFSGTGLYNYYKYIAPFAVYIAVIVLIIIKNNIKKCFKKFRRHTT